MKSQEKINDLLQRINDVWMDPQEVADSLASYTEAKTAILEEQLETLAMAEINLNEEDLVDTDPISPLGQLINGTDIGVVTTLDNNLATEQHVNLTESCRLTQTYYDRSNANFSGTPNMITAHALLKNQNNNWYNMQPCNYVPILFKVHKRLREGQQNITTVKLTTNETVRVNQFQWLNAIPVTKVLTSDEDGRVTEYWMSLLRRKSGVVLLGEEGLIMDGGDAILTHTVVGSGITTADDIQFVTDTPVNFSELVDQYFSINADVLSRLGYPNNEMERRYIQAANGYTLNFSDARLRSTLNVSKIYAAEWKRNQCVCGGVVMEQFNLRHQLEYLDQPIDFRYDIDSSTSLPHHANYLVVKIAINSNSDWDSRIDPEQLIYSNFVIQATYSEAVTVNYGDKQITSLTVNYPVPHFKTDGNTYTYVVPLITTEAVIQKLRVKLFDIDQASIYYFNTCEDLHGSPVRCPIIPAFRSVCVPCIKAFDVSSNDIEYVNIFSDVDCGMQSLTKMTHTVLSDGNTIVSFDRVIKTMIDDTDIRLTNNKMLTSLLDQSSSTLNLDIIRQNVSDIITSNNVLTGVLNRFSIDPESLTDISNVVSNIKLDIGDKVEDVKDQIQHYCNVLTNQTTDLTSRLKCLIGELNSQADALSSAINNTLGLPKHDNTRQYTGASPVNAWMNNPDFSVLGKVGVAAGAAVSAAVSVTKGIFNRLIKPLVKKIKGVVSPLFTGKVLISDAKGENDIIDVPVMQCSVYWCDVKRIILDDLVNDVISEQNVVDALNESVDDVVVFGIKLKFGSIVITVPKQPEDFDTCYIQIYATPSSPLPWDSILYPVDVGLFEDPFGPDNLYTSDYAALAKRLLELPDYSTSEGNPQRNWPKNDINQIMTFDEMMNKVFFDNSQVFSFSDTEDIKKHMQYVYSSQIRLMWYLNFLTLKDDTFEYNRLYRDDPISDTQELYVFDDLMFNMHADDLPFWFGIYDRFVSRAIIGFVAKYTIDSMTNLINSVHLNASLCPDVTGVFGGDECMYAAKNVNVYNNEIRFNHLQELCDKSPWMPRSLNSSGSLNNLGMVRLLQCTDVRKSLNPEYCYQNASKTMAKLIYRYLATKRSVMTVYYKSKQDFPTFQPYGSWNHSAPPKYRVATDDDNSKYGEYLVAAVLAIVAVIAVGTTIISIRHKLKVSATTAADKASQNAWDAQQTLNQTPEDASKLHPDLVKKVTDKDGNVVYKWNNAKKKKWYAKTMSKQFSLNKKADKASKWLDGSKSHGLLDNLKQTIKSKISALTDTAETNDGDLNVVIIKEALIGE